MLTGPRETANVKFHVHLRYLVLPAVSAWMPEELDATPTPEYFLVPLKVTATSKGLISQAQGPESFWISDRSVVPHTAQPRSVGHGCSVSSSCLRNGLAFNFPKASSGVGIVYDSLGIQAEHAGSARYRNFMWSFTLAVSRGPVSTRLTLSKKHIS